MHLISSLHFGLNPECLYWHLYTAQNEQCIKCKFFQIACFTTQCIFNIKLKYCCTHHKTNGENKSILIICLQALPILKSTTSTLANPIDQRSLRYLSFNLEKLHVANKTVDQAVHPCLICVLICS